MTFVELGWAIVIALFVLSCFLFYKFRYYKILYEMARANEECTYARNRQLLNLLVEMRNAKEKCPSDVVGLCCSTGSVCFGQPDATR